MFKPVVRHGLWALALLAACRSLPTDPTPSRSGELIVDAHAHAFNALHLPISGFVAAYSDGDAHLGRLVERLVLLEAPQRCEAPRADVGELPSEEGCVSWLELARAASPLAKEGADELSDEALDKLGDDGFDLVWRCRVELLDRRARKLSERTVEDEEPTDAELDELLDYALGRLAAPPAALAGLALDTGARAVDLLSPLELRAHFERYVRLVWTLTRSSDTVSECLVATYPAADLIIPQMLDMQRWFPGDDDVCRPVEVQIGDMRKVMREHLGRVHAFLPYDPRRDIEDPGYAFSLLREHIDDGFLGVKLYPPMGFRPSGNDDDEILDEGPDPPLEERYDVVLEQLYAWCEAEEIPITAHCNPVGAESAPGRGKRSNPAYWRPVLERHNGLRLNLGHFGGHDLGVPGGWSETIGELMDDFPFVYADVSYHDLPVEPEDIAAWRVFLQAHPKARKRLMFGTDWPVILREEYGHDYLARYRAVFEAEFPKLVEDLLGHNALRYLGLRQDTLNRRRLESFYERVDEGFRPDRWWDFLKDTDDE